MNTKALCAIGILALSLSAVACGGGSPSGTGGAGGTAAGSGGASGTGGAGAAAPTVASACASYCTMYPATCPTCASLSPVLTACIKYAIAERDCSMSGVENSIDYRCANVAGASLDMASPAACKTAYTNWFTCLAGQTKVCIDATHANEPGSCTAEATALGDACSP